LDQYLKNKVGDGMGNEAVHLLFTMNRWEMKKQLVQMLESGTDVICDRYSYSGCAYSVAKGLDFDWCCSAERGLVLPDLVVYFDTSADKIA
jgi:dTMP kinase